MLNMLFSLCRWTRLLNFQTCLASMIETDSVVIACNLLLSRHSHPVLRPQSLVTVSGYHIKSCECSMHKKSSEIL